MPTGDVESRRHLLSNRLVVQCVCFACAHCLGRSPPSLLCEHSDERVNHRDREGGREGGREGSSERASEGEPDERERFGK